jgi:hypothetical protein
MPSTKQQQTKRKVKVKYIPPSADMIERYSQAVCKKLNPTEEIPNMEREFTDFVKTVVRIRTKMSNGEDNAF